MNSLPLVDNVYFHDHTEGFDGDGIYGQIMQYGMVIIPAAWLAIAAIKRRFFNGDVQQPA